MSRRVLLYYLIMENLNDETNDNLKPPSSTEDVEKKDDKEKWSFWEFIRYITIALLIVIPIRMWVTQPFIVSGASMDPTFKNGDYLIIDELSFNLRSPEKGEVVVFRFPLDTTKFFIKRIIGVPGETVEVDGFKTTLEENEYYVMGDNRDESYDSRRWGPVEEKLIIGRAFIRLWPITKIDALPGIEEMDELVNKNVEFIK